MKRRVLKSLFVFVLFVSFLPVAAQNDSGAVPDHDRIEYHNPPVMLRTVRACFVWYGALTTSDRSTRVMGDVLVSLCESTYFLINKICPEWFGGDLVERQEGLCALSYPRSIGKQMRSVQPDARGRNAG